MKNARIEQEYQIAKQKYSELGVDADAAIHRLSQITLSLPCWQGDDVIGFESKKHQGGSAIQASGSFPGRARNADELRQDLTMALSLIPGQHRVNLHAIYGEFGTASPDRNEVDLKHFAGWVDWAKANRLHLDFNATCFSHPKAGSGFTLSDRDPDIRAFWIEHVKRCRRIAVEMGRMQGSPCTHNLWIPDGAKDATVDSAGYRKRLRAALDEIYSVAHPSEFIADSLESKLFGIGTESFVVGSHEFYMGYALKHDKMLCLDMGHFHPTETVSGKMSALLEWFPQLLIHMSRGVRWDSDHFVILSDELQQLMNEVVLADGLGRISFALDFFDAGINRVGAWVISARATQKALLAALLNPIDRLRSYESDGNNFAKFALLEEMKAMPLGAVWDHYCTTQDKPIGASWIETINQYGKETAKRT